MPIKYIWDTKCTILACPYMLLQHPQAELEDISHMNFGAFYSLTRKRSRGYPRISFTYSIYIFNLQTMLFRKGQSYINLSNHWAKKFFVSCKMPPKIWTVDQGFFYDNFFSWIDQNSTCFT